MLAVVSYGAGGAEILSSYVRQNAIRCLFVLDGPARRIFEGKLGVVDTLPLAEAVQKAGAVLCGSGWQGNLEVEAIRLARTLGKPSTVFLDHWVYYRERFERAGGTHLPDSIWVGDDLAKALAEGAFPGVQVRLVENPYFADIRREWREIEAAAPVTGRKTSVLYLCEPLRAHSLAQFGHERAWGYVEEDALRYFLSHLSFLHPSGDSVIVRPHPSERHDKYRWIADEFDVPVTFGGDRSLLEEMSECETVVGCESMAMVVGLLAGKRVISCVPPGGQRCALPHPEIEHLQAIVSSSARASA